MITDEQKKLIGEVYGRVWDGISKGDATSHLEWLGKQETELVRGTCLSTQPNGWAVLFEPFVKSLDDAQAAMLLAALVAVFVQAKGTPPVQTTVEKG